MFTTRARVGFVLLAIFVGSLAGCTLSEVNEWLTERYPPTVDCYEDEPCWDCHTMGNLICGPDGG